MCHVSSFSKHESKGNTQRNRKQLHIEPNKITLVGWVDKTLDKIFFKHNFKFGFKVTRMWYLNPRVVNDKIYCMVKCV